MPLVILPSHHHLLLHHHQSVTSSLVSGFLITNLIHCTKSSNAASCQISWLVRSLEGKTLVTRIGDGNLTTVIFQALLERLRNKRLVFVGDSLVRGQWVSMVCLVDSILPKTLKSMHSTANASLNIFKAKEYNASIEHYWSPLLVESNSDDPVNHKVVERTVRVKAIEKHAKYWTDADFLVFNTYLWWRRPVMNVLWGSFGDPDGVYKGVEMLRVYEMALRTWSDWLEVHVNRNKTRLFFVSMSPTHERAEEWGAGKGNNCYSETDMIAEEGYWGKGSDPKMMRVVENVLDDLKERGLNVQMLNITQLSEYRKEGHPSIYRKQWNSLTQEQIANPKSYADCIHWCLPGVPDVWNELLYAHIFYQ